MASSGQLEVTQLWHMSLSVPASAQSSPQLGATHCTKRSMGIAAVGHTWSRQLARHSTSSLHARAHATVSRHDALPSVVAAPALQSSVVLSSRG